MPFRFDRNKIEIKKIYDDFQNDKLIVDQSYQRRKVWLEQDKVRLIETILLGLIIPEVFFWPAEIDPATGESLTHIVDGQQRINSIVEFISNKFKLSEKYLMNQEIKTLFGNCDWLDLPNEAKSLIWTYKLSVVDIDRQCSKEDIKNMFFRLNLTNYNLNNQEKRKSKESYFGDMAETLAEHDFWKLHKVFSAADGRRMNDILYCCSIYILAIEGIVDQTNDKKINDYYDDYKDSFDNDGSITNKITLAMNIINCFTTEKTYQFISKKAQIYTLFSFVFNMIDKNWGFKIDNEKTILDNEIFNKFELFVIAYNNFKNEYDLSFDDSLTNKVYEDLKRYKLASSEGINKLSNRVIRLEVLTNFLVNSEPKIKDCFNTISSEFIRNRTASDFEILEGSEID